MTILLQIRHNVEKVKYGSLWGAHGVLKRLQRQTATCTHIKQTLHSLCANLDDSLKFKD